MCIAIQEAGLFILYVLLRFSICGWQHGIIKSGFCRIYAMAFCFILAPWLFIACFTGRICFINTTDILSDDKNLADVDSLSGGLLTQYGSGNYAITVEAGKVISVSVTDSGIKKTCTITDGTIKIE